MLNDFIGGGQVFLHKVRMFWQVFTRTIHIAFLIGIIAAGIIHSSELSKLDWQAFYSYHKAVLADDFDCAMNKIRVSIGNKAGHVTFVSAKNKTGIWAKKTYPQVIIRSYMFSRVNNTAMQLFQRILVWASLITLSVFSLIFLVWSRFGKELKKDKTKEGENGILTAKEVRKKLHKIGKASDLKIGDMPLIKDIETRHFLITGSSGSGKTNLIHNLLPQIENRKQPAVIIDQTGEMIAKYYRPERGDIIFNPFDERSIAWDFWADCASREDLEHFSKILISFDRKRSGSRADPFWENAAQSVFNSCIEFLRPKQASIRDIVNMVCYADVRYLRTVLAGSEASRYLTEEAKQTAGSIISVLAANTKPLSYLPEITNNCRFSMREHFAAIKGGSTAWLFLSTKPSARSLTLPLIACLTELAFIQLMDIGIDKNRKVWTVIDELPALGVLPALPSLITEGRKYGACVIACMQSLNQLFNEYGQYAGSYIFGQFGTSFFFRNTEPAIAKMVGAMCGTKTVTHQQKNTSYGAYEFRDGVSYSEQQQKDLLIEAKDLANLNLGECYTLSAEPAVRLAKVQTLKAVTADKHEGFVAKKVINKKELDKSITYAQVEQTLHNIKNSTTVITSFSNSQHSKSDPIDDKQFTKIVNDFTPKM